MTRSLPLGTGGALAVAPAALLQLALAAVLALGAVSAASSAPADPIRFYEESVRSLEYVRAGDWAAAGEILDGLVAEDPENSTLWNRLGTCRYHLREWEPAIAAYRASVRIGTPFPSNVLYNIACCQALAGRTDDAFGSLRRALDAGLEDRRLLQTDADLVSLREDPRWPAVAGVLPDRDISRDEGWRTDLDFLVAEIARLHPDPYARHQQVEIDAAVTSLRERIPRLPDAQVRLEMQKILVMLGDGHSTLGYGGHGPEAAHSLPVQFYAFADGLFVIGADGNHQDLIGRRVLALGGRPVEDVMQACTVLVPHDNAMGLKKMVPWFLAQAEVLRNLGVMGAEGEITLTLAPAAAAGGGARQIALRPDNFHPRLGPASSWTDAAEELPLWLAREDDNYWFTPLEGTDAVFLQFNSVRNDDAERIPDFARRLSAFLRDHDVRDVILDLRHNGGGNSFLYPPLVRVLVAFEQNRDDARLWVLIGRNTYSAAQNLATDLDGWTGAVFAGEPSGSRPNVIGEHTVLPLPFSGLEFSVSSRLHQQSYAGDERAWIAPEIPVAMTSADYFAGRDPVLEAVLGVIRAQESR